MKKLFVSVPMKNRTEDAIKESIKKMQKIAETIEGEELELIDSYVEGNPPKSNHESVWYLGKSLEKLAEADVFMGISDSWDFHGCQIEKEVASDYGIKSYYTLAEYVIPNYREYLHEVVGENEGIVCYEAKL